MKGQAALEFAGIATILIIFFIAIQILISDYQRHLSEANDLQEASQIALELSTAINFAAQSLGFESNVTLPSRLKSSSNFTAMVSKTAISLTWNNNAVIESIQTAQVQNNSGSTAFELKKGLNVIKNGGTYGSVTIQ